MRLINDDKYKRHLKLTNDYIRFGKPYLETANAFLQPYQTQRTNRIIDKGFKVSDKVSDIIDIITK